MKRALPTCLFIATLAEVGSAQIVQFDFNDTSSVPATLSASLIAPNIASVTQFSVSDGIPPTTNVTTASPPDSPAINETGGWADISPVKYFSFAITPLAGYQLNISGISFDYRQTATGAAQYQISIGDDSNASNGLFTRDSTWRVVSDSVTASGLTEQTEIRIYGYDGGSGNFGIDRVTIDGTVTAIPEPAAFAWFAALGALGLAVTRRRCRDRAVHP